VERGQPQGQRGAEGIATGTIKKLVGERGFGFITAQDGSELFFHHSAAPAFVQDPSPRLRAVAGRETVAYANGGST
jgi:hypothetical protein